MEKLAYVLWKRGDEADEVFKRRLLEETAPRLLALPAAPLRLRISVADDDVAAGKRLRLGRMDPPKAAFVSFWMEQAQERGGVERVLSGTCGRFAGYLVVESRPLVNRTARAGARTPGFALVSCIEPKDGLAYDEFLRLWHEQQRACAIETQATFGYVRNEIVRALTPDAPGLPPLPRWAAIVEENFPLAALSDPAAFYDAVGDPAKLKRNLARMLDTCQGFLAQERVESHPMSEYVF
jgi:hypothetical protein